MDKLRERGRRHKVRLDAAATRGNGSEVKAIVTDLSLDGCCLIGPFKAGERVSLKIPNIGSLAAEVRWAFMGRAGARFMTRVNKRLGERGAAAIEYALLASLIALAIVAALTNVGGEVEGHYNSVDEQMQEGTKFKV